jgi:response regulator RpfG family c-di-GMP phosphodiesterase
MSELKSEFISYIMSAATHCSLYSKKHPFVNEFSEKALKTAEGLYIDDRLILTLLGDTLLINDEPIREKGQHIKSLIKRMKRKGIERIVIERTVEPDEFQNFIASLSGQGDILSTDHISVGTIEVKLKTGESGITSLINEGIEKSKAVYNRVSRFKRLDTIGLEEIVAAFVSALKRESNVLKIISPVKSHSEYTYVHITNVSILTIFQAELFGLKGDILYEAGIAGLLHDIGKTFISQEILEKKEALSPSDWQEIKKHPVYGALYLSTLPDIPRLAVIAAFEHHMKYDGSGYPDTRSYNRRPHIISQMVAIADFFDALRTHRAYRRSMGLNEIIAMIVNSRGKDFYPLVVDTFINGLNRIRHQVSSHEP